WTWAHWGGQNTFAAASALALFGGVFLIQALRPAPTLEKEAD
ncbi:MFS transporter, partial [Acidithiobacillus ferridurans]|nr:MFS transporter [Acidithiobacillus ferridurans]